MIKRAQTAAKYLVPAIIAIFIGRAILNNWEQVRAAEWQFDPLYLLASFALGSVWFIMRPLVWGLIVSRFGYHIPYLASFGIMRQAELSRFVPGSVWQFVSRVVLAGRWGVPPSACLGATVVEVVLVLLAAMMPALLVLDEALPELGSFHRVMLVLFPLASIAIVHPRLLNAWAGFLAKRLNQPWTDLKIRWATIAAIWLLDVLMWALLGLSVGLFVRGVMFIPSDRIWTVAGYYAAAWTVGMLTMISPAGMGVREGALGFLLSRAVGLGAGLTLAIAVRLWLTFGELFWAAVAMKFTPQGPVDPIVRE